MSQIAQSMLQEERLHEKENGPAIGPVTSSLPVTVIERRSDWQIVSLPELWRYRELIYFLTWRDIQVKYKQSVLGVAWVLLQPLATMLAFSLFLGRVAAKADAEVPYPLFILAGLLPWQFFAAAVGTTSTSVVANEKLVTKVYFPRIIVPLSTVAAALFDHVISLGLLLVIMICFGFLPGVCVLVVPLVTLITIVFATGLGSLLAALCVAYRDFRVIVPLMLQLWMFTTPAIFLQDSSVLGPRMQAAMLLNPMQGLVANFRAGWLAGPIDWLSLGIAAVWAVVFFAIGGLYFRRVEKSFADII